MSTENETEAAPLSKAAKPKRVRVRRKKASGETVDVADGSEIDYQAPSPLQVYGKDEKRWYYRFIRPKDLNKRRRQGYVVEDDPSVQAVMRSGIDGGRIDGTVGTDDLVLMKQPRALREKRDAYWAQQIKDSEKQTSDQFKKVVRDAGEEVVGKGVRTYYSDDGE